MAIIRKPKTKQEKDKETIKKPSAQILKAIAKVEGFIGAIGDGINIIDRTFRVIYQNQVHKYMMGDHVGEFCYKAYVKRQGVCSGCPIAITFKDGKVHVVQRERKTEEGTRYAEITTSPLKDSTGKIIAGIEMVRDITERKKAEAALKQSEEKFRNLFNSASDAIAIHDMKGHFFEVNDTLCNRLGYSREELLHMAARDVDTEENANLVQKRINTLKKQGYLIFETAHVSRDGKVIPVEVYSRIIDYEGEKAVLSVARDITDRKRAEEELKEKEEKYRVLFNNVSDAIFVHEISPDITEPDRFRIIEVNDIACQYLGYTREELLQMNMPDIDAPSTLENIPPILNTLFKEGRATWEGIHIHRDGHKIPVEINNQLFDLLGKPIVLSSIRDITERKHSEQALKENEQKLRNIIEHSNELYYVHDTNKVLTYVSPQSLQILGYNPDEMMIEWTNLATDNPINEKGIEITEKTLKTGEKQGLYVLELYKKNRSKVLLEIDESPIKDEKGVVVGLAGAARDVTESVKAEEAIRASEAELHDSYFAQSAINMMLSESLEDRPLKEILQKALNMILSVPWLSFEAVGGIHLVETEPGILSMKAQLNLPEQLKNLCAHVSFGKCLCGRAALTQKIEFADHIDERHEICYEGIAPHGHYVVPILFGGKTLGVIDIYLKEGHIRDQREEEFLLTVADTLAGIIVRKQIEEEKEKLHAHLLQAQKMEAVGQLAGGVAHDFNNILTAMIGYGHLLKVKMKEDDPLRNYADHILSLSDKAANLTQSLLAFSRKQIIDPRPIDLNEIIRRIEHLLTRIIGENIRLQTMLSEEDLIVMADPGQIEQVLMNLATNAKDAMHEGGLLTIQTETEYMDQVFIRDHVFGKEGSYALITITDTGAGMDRKTGEKIFEPFFTTKEVGKGTGLGLSMAYGIIKQHEGYIKVYSEPGRGTSFRIYLPLTEAKIEESKPAVIHAIEKGTETVLLAEDQAEVREFTKRLLEEYGYQVITAADGQNAIDKFKLHRDKIQLLILDVIMPNKSGKEVYEETKLIKPNIKVLFMSGHPADVIHKHGILEKGFAYIKKPASPTKLLRKIREVLNE